MNFFEDGGFMMYPLTACAGLVLAMGGWSALRLFASDARPEPRTKATLDGVLFWGAFAVILGVLGTVIGVMVAAQAIERIGGEVSPALVWGGIKVAMSTTAFGILILAIASLIWFGLKLRYVALEPSSR